MALFILAWTFGTGLTAAKTENSSADNPTGNGVTAHYLTAPLAFEANIGQADARVDYLAHGTGYSVFLIGGDVVLALQSGDKGHAVLMNIIGRRRSIAATGESLLGSYSNYLVGSNPAAWHTGVANFAAVRYADVYKGIDVRYYGNQRQLEYDFIVAAGADARQIRLEFTGIKSAILADNGDLCLTLNAQGDRITFKAPVAYQMGRDGRQSVDSRYVIHDDSTVGFELSDYDANRALVIDPTLSYVTFLGGLSYDTAQSIAVDGSGNAYITGWIGSADFPTTVGALDRTYNGGSYDIYVAKLSPDGTSLVYSTFIGGSGNDMGNAIAVDSVGNAYVAGQTVSTNFPAVNAYQDTLKGTGDAFLLKLNNAGNSLLYCTYFGGTSASGSEVAYALALDASNIAYLSGQTYSSDMPLKGAYDATLGGTYDAFVAKFDLSRTGVDSLLYSSFFGGSGSDYAKAIVVDGSGAFTIAGVTDSTDLTTLNAYQATSGGGTDAFITQFTSSGGTLTYSTYLGGSATDWPEALAVDSSGKIYVGGYTNGTFPTSVGAYDTTAGGSADGFVSKIDPTLSGTASMIYSTYLGSTGFDYVIGLDVDPAGVAYITGFTSSSGFPTTTDGADRFMTGSNDGFFATLNATGSSLTYSTFLGGSGQDRGLDVVWSSATGSAYVSGIVGATDWPSSPTATHLGPEGDTDGFVAKFTFIRPKISSAANQAFSTGDPSTAISTITVTDDAGSPTITAANDIRIRIPSGFNMTWDTSDTAAVIGGVAAAKVSGAMSYEDGGKTLVINVTSNFAASDQITISGLSFSSFTAVSPAANLELEVDNGSTVAALDDKTISILAPTISSAANQAFIVDNPSTAISHITVSDRPSSPMITAANDIRIRIPSSFNMTWDTADTTASITGTASGKVSTTVSYEDSGKTLVIDVTSDFAASDAIVVAGLSFTNFSAISAADHLELEVRNNDAVQATDDKTIIIRSICISSAANQDFIVGSATTAISAITITDDSETPLITATNDIRVRIPDRLYMTWDTTVTTATITGTGSGKVSTTVSYEDNGKTLVINVTSNFNAGDAITVSALKYGNFTTASYGDHLELEVGNDGTTIAEDDKYIALGGWPSSGSMLAYGEGTVTTPRYRTWNGSVFSLEGTAADADDTIKWTVLKASPVANEMILGVYSSATRTLFIQTWNGTSWTANWSTVLNYDGATRIFDLAYETNSGDAIVVFGNADSNDLRYRKRVGGVWDSSNQTISAITPDNEPNFVRAKSHPASNDIFVATIASSKSLYALRWNGSSNTWDNGIQTTAGVKSQDREGFDLAFERASGHAFLIWGDAAANLKYREFTTSWQAESTAYSLPDDVFWLVADYDPVSTSSKIAVGMLLENITFEFGAWNGSSWVTRPSPTAARNRDQRGIDVKFQSSTGQAIYIFCQSANPTQMAWRTWSSSGGFDSVTVASGTAGNLNFMNLKPNPGGNDMMAVYADANGNLNHRYYTGSSWSALTDALETGVSAADKSEPFMFAWKNLQPTAVNLIAFTATGSSAGVCVSWQTAQESGNKGFNLYRTDSAGGAYAKLNAGLIPTASVSSEGKSYRFRDATAMHGRLYYYKLEDVDASGVHTLHGPVCVDWDADGIPDDWEIAHGLDPGKDDASEDPDGDGAPNGLEYRRGTDPQSLDTDGNGIPDGDERKRDSAHGGAGGLGALRGVSVLNTDAGGQTLELWTPGFDTTPVSVGGEAFERLRVTSYVHGYSGEPGSPQLPVKGLLIDVPEGKRAKLTVLSVSAQRFPGYRLYPTPAHAPAGNELLEVFTLDGPAYGRTGFEPGEAAELSIGYLAHGGVRQRLVFYPFGFNPATGELLQRERIRVRVDFVADAAGQPALARVPAAALSAVAGGGWTPGHRHAAYKITTAAEGIYRITRDWLMAQGIGAVEADGIDLAQVRLYHLGVEQAIEVADANGNSRLDAGDFVGFYAAPVPEAYRKFTRYNCYWLISGGGAGALRMAQVAGAPAGGGLAASHAGTVHHELDQLYLQSAQGADALDRWIFSTIAVGPGFADPQAGLPKNFNFSLPGALGSGDLTVRLYSPYDLDHAVTISVNGVEAGTVAWSGIGFGEATFADVAFNPGANTVSILCAGATDKAGLDWVQTHYARSFAASADSLKFSHTVGYRYLLTGFTGSEIGLYDITDPAAVSRVVGGTISGSGPYSLEVEPTVTVGNRTYLAVASAAIPTPAAAVEDTASSLREPAEGADWILITSTALGWDGSGDLNGWVEELVTLRRAQGLRCAVVDVTDIFDEFGYGFATPAAIRAFLSHAYANWPRPAPRYVLIVGDATYDFKNNWNLSPAPVNHVPAWLIATTYLGETATDERYVQFSADGGLAQMAIGRLPAATLTQAEAMAAKIVSYETAANTKSWQRRVVLAADNRIDDWEAVFETMGEDAAALLPAGMESPQRFYLAEYENEQLAATDLTADLLPAINAGALIVYYSGHGSLNLWATERMIDNRGGAYRDDVDSLSNTGRYPFVVNMACLSGYFLYPFAGTSWQSLAEGFMRAAEAGAVAALMPTAMTAADGQQVLSNALFEALFAEDQRRLGDALGAARQALLANSGVATQETADTFMLFGDPATVLQVPLPRRPSGLSAARQGAVVMLSWQPALDADGAPVAGYHIYRRAAGETSFRRLTQAPLNALAFTDTPATGLAAQGSWQYALTSVDGDGLESVLSQVAALTPNPDQENEPLQSATGSGSGGGCFVSVATAGASSCGPAAAILTALMALPTALCALRPTTRKFRRIRSGRRVRRSGKSKRLSIFRHCFFDLERPTVLPDKNIGKG